MEQHSNTHASKGAGWNFEAAGVSDLASTSAGVAAAITIDTINYLIGIDFDGRSLWRIEAAGDPVLVAKKNALFAAMERRIMSIDPATGTIGAVREIDPPLGGWTKSNTLSFNDDLLTVDASGLLLLAGANLETKWHLPLELDRDDAIQQVVHSQHWIAAISNRSVMLVSEQGALQWQRDLPQGTRFAGTYPLVFARDRLLIGLVRTGTPVSRFICELSLNDGELVTETSVDDLAMFCPAHVFDDLLVLDTSNGLAGFNIAGPLQRSWSIDAPMTTGACVAADRYLLVSAWQGTLLRVAVADGKSEVLFELPRKRTLVPPAPSLDSTSHMESVGVIEHLAVMPHGIAFSVTWSKEHATIQFILSHE
jgi:hypothetical protein